MRDIIVMGLGELGQLYATAALKAGLRVTPLTRSTSREDALANLPPYTPVLVAVGEKDLESAVNSLPATRRDALILLQNELFPSQWERLSKQPTIMIPWLLKKKGEPLLVARSTPVYGPEAELVETLHQVLGFQAQRLTGEQALRQAVVDKYAFILCVNALGLVRDLTLGEWLASDPAHVAALSREAALLGEKLASTQVDVEQTMREVRAGIEAMGGMRAKGRTAQERVLRALEHAKHWGVAVPALEHAAHVARP